ncbi:MAG: hypothetical protein OEV95_09440 [Gemmatimonadota bacterium]|nr:hypothetical protein [Gemmatimonadota bacterium]
MVRRFIKTGLGFLGLGLLLGAYLLVRRELEGVFPDRYLISAHVHAVGVGFVMFMILGVALWLFPKPAKEDTRYRPARIEAAYWVLVIATGARVLAELARASLDATWLRALVVAAGLGQVAGLAIYFYTMWTRIRPVGSQLREAKGERF